MPTFKATKLGVLIGIVLVPGLARGGELRSLSGLQIEADRLELGAHHKELRLKGHVRVQTQGPRGEVQIRASRVVVRLDRTGTPLGLTADGALTVRLGSSRATAGRLQLRIPKTPRGPRVVELLGNVRLELARPRLIVAGERVQLELESGRMSVDRARLELVPVAASAPGGEGHGG